VRLKARLSEYGGALEAALLIEKRVLFNE
jgi:hypothetical protein